MASFFFNVIRGSPSTPTTTTTTTATSIKQKLVVADYCGVFDCNSMKWVSVLPPLTASASSPVPSASASASPFLASPTASESSSNNSSSDCSAYTPIWNNIPNRNQTGVENGFIEKQRTVKSLDDEFNLLKKGVIDRAMNKSLTSNMSSPGSTPSSTSSSSLFPHQHHHSAAVSNTANRPIRIVAVSDTHQYHRALTLPVGDVLIVAGDILLSDRLNPAFVSKYYLNDFYEWLGEQPHKVKIFVFGNHDDIAAQMGEAKIQQDLMDLHKAQQKKSNENDKKKGCDIFFLTGNEILDVYGVRFFGNSISFGSSPNQAFQDKETLNKLKSIPYDNVIDTIKLIDGGMTNKITDEYLEQKRNKTTTRQEGNNESKENNSSTATAVPHLLQPRSDETRAVDVLITHSRLFGGDGDAIVKKVNPVCHIVGHEHESHGMDLGIVDRSLSWASNISNRFSRRSLMSSLWSTLFSFGNNETTALNNEAPKTMFVDNVVPEINVAVVGELHCWNPKLQPPMVFDMLPMESI